MLRKTEKKMKQKEKPNEKKYPSSWNYFIHKPSPRTYYNFNYSCYANITYSGQCVIKSWRFPPRQCATASSGRPTLVEMHAKHRTSRDTKLVYKSRASSPNDPFEYQTSLLVTGDCAPAFAFCIERRLNPVPWTIQSCNIEEPYDPSQNMRFFNVVEFKRRFFAMSLQGSVVVINKMGSDRLGITKIGGSRAVPSKACRHFREYMVESDGEILVVFLVSSKSMDVVDDVEVLRLDVKTLLWTQVRNIGDRAFFFEDEGCVKCEKVFKKNCIYFTHPEIEEWLVFDMETRAILPALELKIQAQE